MPSASPTQPHVVIVGGGFAGLYAAKSLGHASVQVTLVDRRNFHLFQPLLYQVATGHVTAGEIASPLRAVLGRCWRISPRCANIWLAWSAAPPATGPEPCSALEPQGAGLFEPSVGPIISQRLLAGSHQNTV